MHWKKENPTKVYARPGAEFSISGTDAPRHLAPHDYDCVTLDMHAGSRADTRAPVLILLSACD